MEYEFLTTFWVKKSSPQQRMSGSYFINITNDISFEIISKLIANIWLSLCPLRGRFI